MARYGMAIDTARCMACYNCFIACKDEHCGYGSALCAPQPHMGQYWMHIRERERGDTPEKVRVLTVPTPCSHCEDPACMRAARDGAVYKRDDGIVIIDPERSKGQRAIAEACPIGAVYWNEELDIPQKCTLCAELLDDPEYMKQNPGRKQPRCSEACPNQALIFGDLDDPDSEISRKIAQGRITPLAGLENIKTQVVHLNIPRVLLAGFVCLPGDEVAIGAQVKVTELESGAVYSATTNWAGDWEVDDLPRDKEFSIEISHEGYKDLSLSARTDTDHTGLSALLERAG